MAEVVPENTRKLLKDAANQLHKAEKRRFMAKVTLEYCDGSARKAERVFGWNRDTVKLGLHEHRTGITCIDNYRASGRKRTEERTPEIVVAIEEVVEEYSQADPSMKSPWAYTRITASAVYNALLEANDYKSDELPSPRTLNNILNRLGYRLRSVQKTKPKKKSRKLTQSSKTSDK